MSLLLTLPFMAAFVAIPDTIMRAFFQHGAFDRSAAALSAIALATYGVGLPAMALTRIFQATFYARHDTMTPARVTVTAIAVNIALKFLLVWGFHLGIAGIALGTSFGAWVNVGLLVWLGHRHNLLQLGGAFWRALFPICLAAACTGGAGYAAVHFGGYELPDVPQRQVVLLALAIAASAAAYGAVVLAFRNKLPVGRSFGA
jgi:putative peptidoglycan lipid II flippase